MKSSYTLPLGIIPFLIFTLFLSAQGSTVVDLQYGMGTVPLNRTADVDNSNEYTVGWNADTKFFDGDSALSQAVYAGYSLTGAGTVGGAALLVDDGDEQMKFIGLNDSTDSDVVQRLLVLWDSADFLVPGHTSFDNTADSSLSFSAEIRRHGPVSYRFVIRDGDDYYMSSVASSQSGLSVDLAIDGTEPGLEWGAFDPQDFGDFADASDAGMGVAFSSQTFSNVTGVGVIATVERTGGNNPEFNLWDFQAELAAAPTATVVDLKYEGFGTVPLNRLADVDTVNEYTVGWNAATKFFDGDSELGHAVYAGYSLTGAGTVGGATLLVDNDEEQMKFIGLNDSSDSVVVQRLLILWGSEDFLVPGHNTFDATAHSSLSLSAEVRRHGPVSYRFVIREGDDYYMSSVSSSQSGLLVDLAIDGTEPGLQWGAFDPEDFCDFANASDAGMGVVFSSQTFSNVTGVGVIATVERTGGNNPEFNLWEFQADLVGDSPPVSPVGYLTERPEWAGVWVNTRGFDEPLQDYFDYGIIAGESSKPRWGDIEETKGVFDFSEIEDTLQRCLDRGYYYYPEIWTSHWAPEWLYDNGVPKVEFTDFPVPYPYYIDEDYIYYVTRFFNELAGFIANLSPELRERFAFIQIGFGSTGDRQLYKGQPVNSAYEISAEEYVDFMKTMTLEWHSAFNAYPENQNLRFLWNISEYDGPASETTDEEEQYASWMYENYNTQFRKQQFTIAIGYMSNREASEDEAMRTAFYGTPERHDGHPEYIRGEHNDPKWAETPMALIAPKWHYYWTAIAGIDRGLDGWETRPANLLLDDYLEAYYFSTRHSFQKVPETAERAFIALRDVLDYSDTERFPPAIYGLAQRTNTDRIDAILAEYAPYGAANDDTAAVTSLNRSAYILNSTGLNDCVWQVIDRNYQRHMSQITPNDTSVGLWRVGSTDDPYGRFARSFEYASGKNAMYFNFDPQFFSEEDNEVRITVIYFDDQNGSSWDLRYDSTEGWKTALSVTNIGGNVWRSVDLVVTDARMEGNGPNGADIALINTDNQDNIFHLIEVEKLSN